MPEPISPFYRIIFTIVDPIFTLVGIAGNLLAPTDILKSYTPLFVSPPAPETTFLLGTTAGWYAASLVNQVYILRARPNDLAVWRAIQGGTAIVDVAMLAGIARILAAEKRLNLRRGARVTEPISSSQRAC